MKFVMFDIIYRNNQPLFQNCHLIVGRDIEVGVSVRQSGPQGSRYHNSTADKHLEGKPL